MQLVDAATGLEYMHSLTIVHGDLKGVRFFNLLDAQMFTENARQISSSIKVIVPASWILVFLPLPVESTIPELTHP
jgi:hypothetical protein